MATVHFLLAYSHLKQKLVTQQEFTDSRRATKAYAEAEAKHAGDSDYEIVLIGSDSIQTIMKTHGHYFAEDSHHLMSQFEFADR
ncbi:hypothetical protein M3667_01815 [Microbacterium sp. P26]|uniref:hypothetical protein n=1 Tax=Microbacterium TaxID=33882 RepID=UPI0020420391|nr:hypothetical protein [Microbacterium sp. P26]MCM3500614.1 hypothetical protein [Microbacterium sp. P26]